MGSKHLKPTIFLLAAVLWANFATAQATAPYLKEVLILNGGQFGNPQEQANLIGYNPTTGDTRVSDTIHMNSIQDLLIDGDFAYIAAQDSIVKIRLSDFSRVAIAKFPGPSTNVMAVHQNQLLVGNFYGQADSNLYVYDKADLSLEHIVGGITQGVKGIAVVGDTAYVAQNITTANYTDSAGYLALVYLPTGSFVKDVLGNNVSDIGKLFPYKGGVIGFGSEYDAGSLYVPATGQLVQAPLGLDLQAAYGTTMQLVDDTLFAVFDGKIGSFNVFNLTVIDADIVDTLITGFQYDVVGQQFYVTQTDYFSYTRGIIFDKTGVAVDTFVTGFSPEVVQLWYGVNNAPVAVDDNINGTAYTNVTIFPLDNDTDVDGDSLVITIVTPPYDGTATVNGAEIFYEAGNGSYIVDSLKYSICDISGASLCSEAWIFIYLNGVGVDEVNAYQIMLFPNPVNDRLSIRLTGNGAQTLLLRDLTGRTLSTVNTVPNSLTQIELGVLAPGLYLLQSADGRFTQKVVKQ